MFVCGLASNLAAIIDDLYNEMDDLEDEMAFTEEQVRVGV
jgi:hypothetical protein